MSAASSLPAVDAHRVGASPSPSSDSLSVLENAWSRFSDGVATLQQSSQLAQRRLELEFTALDSCQKTHDLLLKEYVKLQQLLTEVEREQGSDHASLLADYRLKLGLLKTALDRHRDTKPRGKNNLGMFMRLMVGQVPMTLWRNSDRIRFKDEYNKFKARTTLMFIIWPFIQLAITMCGTESFGGSAMCFGFTLSTYYIELLLQAHQLWLLYYYTTLALRENILLANGSDILHWWIHHHYISMFIAALMLLWPSAYLLQERRMELLSFGLLQGLVMLFQNNYQKKRLYVRKTLGKARAIDVESSETLVEKPTDLQALIPMLFVLYATELWFGLSFTLFYWRSRSAALAAGTKSPLTFSVVLVGAAFVVLALGNAWTTGRVLLSKSKSRSLKTAVHRRISSAIGGKAAPAAAADNKPAAKKDK